ncbi:trehalose-6-phosphate synthase [Candidatus Methanomassiliicoccus intestinalis]|uniref:trehalose-6-phosphate synthase n=1 Tax=Candidatus Methanomassiliicoccus intestinalis TaxID=1406512 RepID=UPI0037DCD68A
MDRLIVISNREPYVHEYNGEHIDCSVPTGGVVAAIDPVMQAAKGTWIAWGSGDADQDCSDAKGCVRVPPTAPQYTLRRIWLTQKEVNDYYLGFSNRVIWPVCHLFQENAQFKKNYWEVYKSVNQKFAEAAAEELEAGGRVFIQDVHFSLVPDLLRKKVPEAAIALFWHIPFPAAETFSCIPWRKELLTGLLSADMLGFHTKAHADNFISTVCREFPQAEVKDNVINYNERKTKIAAIPIGIDYETYAKSGSAPHILKGAEATRKSINAERIILGVDRLDYTKGILNRFLAFERYLEANPRARGKVSFIQIASPTRVNINEYKEMKRHVEETVGRINGRFQTPSWTPIIYINRKIEEDKLLMLYKIADVAMVTPVIDGMNLVAKEYVAVNEKGVLILSEFAGASEGMKDAIVVNPYDIEAMGKAIQKALRMKQREKINHCQKLRREVQEHDIFWWLDEFFRQWEAGC